MRGAIFLFSLLFTCCCFLHYWLVVILTALQTTTVVWFLCSVACVPLNVPTDFSVFFRWTGNGQEWTWCCSRMDIRVCVVFSFNVFSVVVCTIFTCAVFLWTPEHLCDLGLDLGDEINERETTTETKILHNARFRSKIKSVNHGGWWVRCAEEAISHRVKHSRP